MVLDGSGYLLEEVLSRTSFLHQYSVQLFVRPLLLGSFTSTPHIMVCGQILGLLITRPKPPKPITYPGTYSSFPLGYDPY